MRRIALTVLILAAGSTAAAQEHPGSFDAALYLSMINIRQPWAVGSLSIPPNTVQSFTDTIRAFDDVIAFTVRFADVDTAGWRMWLDYEADRHGALRLVRLIARRHLASTDSSTIPRMTAWIEKLVGRKLMDRSDSTAERWSEIRWKWTPQYEYWLRVLRTAEPHGEGDRLYIILDRGRG